MRRRLSEKKNVHESKCLPVDPSAGVCEVPPRDAPPHQWGWRADGQRQKEKRSMQIKHNNRNKSKPNNHPLSLRWRSSVEGHHMLRTQPGEHTFVSELPFEGQVARSAILIQPYCTTGTERCCSVTQVTSSPNTQATPPPPPPPPMTRTPRINGGFGHTRQFLEPSGGAFYKSVPPWRSLPGIGPADLGQL